MFTNSNGPPCPFVFRVTFDHMPNSNPTVSNPIETAYRGDDEPIRWKGRYWSRDRERATRPKGINTRNTDPPMT